MAHKYSLTDSDIELLPTAVRQFTGRPTTDSRVNASSEAVTRSYPGADLGIFGLLPYETDYVLHTVKLSGLEPGTKYSYRVGNAEKGWWSEAGVIEDRKRRQRSLYLLLPERSSGSEGKPLRDLQRGRKGCKGYVSRR